MSRHRRGSPRGCLLLVLRLDAIFGIRLIESLSVQGKLMVVAAAMAGMDIGLAAIGSPRSLGAKSYDQYVPLSPKTHKAPKAEREVSWACSGVLGPRSSLSSVVELRFLMLANSAIRLERLYSPLTSI